MNHGLRLSCSIRLETVEISGGCLPLMTALAIVLVLLTPGITHASSAFAKTYAVFVASYNQRTQEARGGVAGTAFFTSPTEAITAYHVLQTASFKVQNERQTEGEIVQIWLVHENEDAIELTPENLRENARQDLTQITLKRGARVPKRYIFELGKGALASDVKTEGFLAQSVGPVLRLMNGKLAIISVEKLNRFNTQGLLETSRTVNLRAIDVNLTGTPCLRLSYRPVVGLSGGPVIAANGKVIGMNSFADPTTRAHTWAIAF
jgi:hypothetical protein